MDEAEAMASKTANLMAACDKFVTWSQTADMSLPSTFDWVASQMHGINHCVFEAETAGVEKAAILEMLNDVRGIQARSPFVSRLQQWPRGYQGDFETVEYLMESANRANPNTVAYWVEKYCLNTAVAQQHRNKVRFQSEQITSAILAGEKRGVPARILILACGSSPDVRLCFDQIKGSDFLLVLNDMDDAALEFSMEKLAGLGDRVKSISGNTFRLINKFCADGPFDLILAGGLFDYLKDDQAAFLIKSITSKLLSANGKFVLTNIAKPNPYKYWMEYCANWFLIERTEEDCKSLLNEDDNNISIRRENSDLSFLVEICR